MKQYEVMYFGSDDVVRTKIVEALMVYIDNIKDKE